MNIRNYILILTAFLLLITSCKDYSSLIDKKTIEIKKELANINNTNTGSSNKENILQVTVLSSVLETRPADKYVFDLLVLSLDKTMDKYGEYEILFNSTDMGQDRALEYIQNGEEITLHWSMTSKDRESKLLPVRIPLLKGLLGHRIFLIRKGEQERFNNIKDIEDLKKFTAGQGFSWPDTKILESNGLKVFTAPKYADLFPMLRNKRFDYFPRGVNEIWPELEAHKDYLTIEENILIKYHAPLYFFLNKNDTKLAERIKEGLLKAIEDGSFDKIFYNHKVTTSIFEKANMKHRTLITLENPLLTPETPIEDQRLWFDVDNL